MSPIKKATTAAERYDVVRRRSRDGRLPPGYPTPRPTAAWPAENVALLERYREWLLSGGASEKQTYYLYVPMAGNALGLNLKPYPEIDVNADLEKALDYVKAKRLSDEWIDMCRNALDKFRHFLRQAQGAALGAGRLAIEAQRPGPHMPGPSLRRSRRKMTRTLPPAGEVLLGKIKAVARSGDQPQL
jgi:hypothetical protein